MSQPLLPGLGTYGSVAYFLALLIKTHTSTNWHLQSWMILSLFMGVGLGSTFEMVSLSNTAGTFTALYAMTQTCEFVFSTFYPTIPTIIFISSVAVWRASLFLHQNPQFVASLFSGM